MPGLNEWLSSQRELKQQENDELKRLQAIEQRLRVAVVKAKRSLEKSSPDYYDDSASEQEIAEWDLEALEEILGEPKESKTDGQ